jgi:hypothetical protein
MLISHQFTAGMTIHQFTLLKAQEKINTVLQSILLAERTERDVHFKLFYLEGFYVELWCDLNEEIVYGMRPFATHWSLEPYLKSVSIAEITGLLKAS